jgi:hypothetical protein
LGSMQGKVVDKQQDRADQSPPSMHTCSTETTCMPDNLAGIMAAKPTSGTWLWR